MHHPSGPKRSSLGRPPHGASFPSSSCTRAPACASQPQGGFCTPKPMQTSMSHQRSATTYRVGLAGVQNHRSATPEGWSSCVEQWQVEEGHTARTPLCPKAIDVGLHMLACGRAEAGQPCSRAQTQAALTWGRSCGRWNAAKAAVAGAVAGSNVVIARPCSSAC